jgi:hypothetical protein
MRTALAVSLVLAAMSLARADTCCCPNNTNQCITCTKHSFMNSQCVGACEPADAKGKIRFERLRARLMKSKASNSRYNALPRRQFDV